MRLVFLFILVIVISCCQSNANDKANSKQHQESSDSAISIERDNLTLISTFFQQFSLK